MDLSGEVGGYVDADVSVDRDLLATPVGIAELDISQSLPVRKDCQHLEFTVVDIDARVDIDRTVGMTYRLGLVCRRVSGGSVDSNGEDSADDSEKLSRKHCGSGL